MTKLSGVVAVVAIIVCVSLNSSAKKATDYEYELGKKEGEKAGYAEVEKIYKEKLNELDSIYNKKINEQKDGYDKKIKTARVDGFSKGQKDKQEEVEKALQKTSVEKEQKGKWNDVLFDVKN